MLVCVDIAIAVALYFLFLAVIPRGFIHLARTEDLQIYMDNLRTYYQHLGQTSDEVEKGIIEDLRILMIEQYGIGITRSQANNFARGAARARAFTSLVVALGLAFVVTTTISVHEVVEGTHRGTIIEGE